MRQDEWSVDYGNHNIRVFRMPNDGARLYVDGELLDDTNDLYASEGGPVLVGVFCENDALEVEVFLSPSAAARPLICVNGECIVIQRPSLAVASD